MHVELQYTADYPEVMLKDLNFLEKALSYVQQQKDCTAADIILSRRWRDYAAKNRKNQTI